VLDAALEGGGTGVDSADVDPLLHAARASTPVAHRATTVPELVGTIDVTKAVGRGIVGSRGVAERSLGQ
jgi:hypothetical protein